MAEKKVDYNQKSPEELAKILQDKEKELFDTKVTIAQRKTKNVHLPSKIRQEVARIKTALRSRELGI